MRITKSLSLTLIGIFITVYSNLALAEQSLGDVSLNATGAFGTLARIMTSGSYLIGFGFAVSSLLQYKAHRDNPSQVTLGKPIFLLFIALFFIFMPMLFLVSGNTIFGNGTLTGGVSGTGSF